MRNDYLDYLKQNEYSEELQHHGVKGQKWGVRHDYQPTGRRGQGSQQKKGLSTGAKIAIGAAGTAALGGAGYLISKKTGINPKTVAKAGASLFKNIKNTTKTNKVIRLKGSTEPKSVTKDRKFAQKLRKKGLADKDIAAAINERNKSKELKQAWKEAKKYNRKVDYARQGNLAQRTTKKVTKGVRGIKNALIGGIKDTFTTKNGKEWVNKSLEVAISSALVGGTSLAVKKIIEDEIPNRKEVSSYMTQNPNKKKK